MQAYRIPSPKSAMTPTRLELPRVRLMRYFIGMSRMTTSVAKLKALPAYCRAALSIQWVVGLNDQPSEIGEHAKICARLIETVMHATKAIMA